MNNITTFETSRALIAAGFPVPKTRQSYSFWYDRFGRTWVTGFQNNEPSRPCMRNAENNEWEFIEDTASFIPAFTATDILRELGSDFVVGIMSDKTWDCGQVDETDCILLSGWGRHTNSAEAAALAYLSKFKQ